MLALRRLVKRSAALLHVEAPIIYDMLLQCLPYFETLPHSNLLNVNLDILTCFLNLALQKGSSVICDPQPFFEVLAAYKVRRSNSTNTQ